MVLRGRYLAHVNQSSPACLPHRSLVRPPATGRAPTPGRHHRATTADLSHRSRVRGSCRTRDTSWRTQQAPPRRSGGPRVQTPAEPGVYPSLPRRGILTRHGAARAARHQIRQRGGPDGRSRSQASGGVRTLLSPNPVFSRMAMARCECPGNALVCIGGTLPRRRVIRDLGPQHTWPGDAARRRRKGRR